MRVVAEPEAGATGTAEAWSAEMMRNLASHVVGGGEHVAEWGPAEDEPGAVGGGDREGEVGVAAGDELERERAVGAGARSARTTARRVGVDAGHGRLIEDHRVEGIHAGHPCR